MTDSAWRPGKVALAVGLAAAAAAAVALHPRAALPVLALSGLLHAARLRQLAIGVLAVLLVLTLAGGRVDATTPGVDPPRRAP